MASDSWKLEKIAEAVAGDLEQLTEGQLRYALCRVREIVCPQWAGSEALIARQKRRLDAVRTALDES